MYCGGDTRCNKLNWSLFSVALFIALVGTGFTLYFYIRCVGIDYHECMDSIEKTEKLPRDEISAHYLDYERWFLGKFGESQNEEINKCEMDLKKCSYPWILITFFGAILFYILAAVPLFVMCCCAPLPASEKQQLTIISEEKTPLKFQDGWTYNDPLLEKKDQNDIHSFPVVLNDVETQQEA
eukprot:TRINITY_DN6721_c0_g1_i1.p4 TRINITY_DN6721_c0_g1~~TRINITY_DN6721_c0_g1_i1.p4  ORF type:complete len:182 (-),score=23.74 TRINITY_DN6721_c0_g1_i1:3273-3818(-)